MKQYLRLINGTIIDLKNERISSVNHIKELEAKEEYFENYAFYEIYYYNEDAGDFIERDNFGGRSMDCIREPEIYSESDRLEDLIDGYYIDRDVNFNINNIFDKTAFSLMSDYAKITDYPIYGFIRIKTGLTFVTKINSKGMNEIIWDKKEF